MQITFMRKSRGILLLLTNGITVVLMNIELSITIDIWRLHNELGTTLKTSDIIVSVEL